eukprot:GHVS01098107.1.p1 GENE.GHVS01098107.1~~GHVS01098107.1.p1  ORF type:complete len:658 (-),score=98.30 GHVS01098107.1:397-2370(-)
MPPTPPPDALEFLKEELQPSSSGVFIAYSGYRLETVHRITLVASALGPAKTRQRLLPYLKELHESCEDELLHALCEEYLKLYDYVGGSDYVQLLVDPLEALAQQEETVVRDQAVVSLCGLIERSSKDCSSSSSSSSFTSTRSGLLQNVLFPLLQRLSKKDKWFTCRVSACALLPSIYAVASDSQQQEDIRSSFSVLSHDDTPMVKRAAASSVQELFKVVDKSRIIESLMSSFQYLWQDETQDCIRVSLLSGLLVFCQKCSVEDNANITVKLLLAAAEDKSWRVRLQLAKLFDKFAIAVGSALTAEQLLSPFQNLLKDTEQDVRLHATKSIEEIVGVLTSQQVAASIVPSLDLLSKDPVHSVRAELAFVVVTICKVLGNELAEKHLMGMLSELLKDDQFEVKLNVLNRAGEICSIAGIGPLSYVILNAMQTLVEDVQWRIRLAVVNLIPVLGNVFGVRTFESRLQSVFLLALTDNVNAVRESAISSIETLARTFGTEWTVLAFTPKIFEIYQNSIISNISAASSSSPLSSPVKGSTVKTVPGGVVGLQPNEKPKSYMTRISILRTIPKLASVMSSKEVEELLLPTITMAFRDDVPNVRFSGAQIAAWLCSHGMLEGKVVQQQISSVLLQLIEEDGDIDVRYFCNEAILECDTDSASFT